MRKRILMCAVVLLCGLFLSGCAAHNDQVILSNIKSGLDSCIGKLTKDKLIMIASTPTDRVTLENGEIWVYKYKKTKTSTTYRSYGGLFDSESESENKEYPYEVRLRFDKNGILVDYVSTGYYTLSDHPFKTINCDGFQSPVTSSGNAPAPASTPRGYIGVKFQPMTKDIAEASGLDKVRGAFVIIAQKNSPAEQAGIKPGDIILAIDGKNINEANALPPIVAATPIGKTVDVVIFRNGKEQTIKVKIGKVNDK
ncbi:MAG: PDZ domain-containing protein [Smithellaceae bacterium]